MFPSLVNCCTIDWFTEWPGDALEKVATKFLEDMDMDDEVETNREKKFKSIHIFFIILFFQIRRNSVKMCGHFHETVRQTSIRYLAETKRHNYVTPTSYLALILTFKSLLTGKRDEILNLKTRYEMGLGKLEFASNQVCTFVLCMYTTSYRVSHMSEEVFKEPFPFYRKTVSNF